MKTGMGGGDNLEAVVADRDLSAPGDLNKRRALAILAMDGQNLGVTQVDAYAIAGAKDRLPRLVKQAEEGEDIAVTRHGKQAASICPAAMRSRRQPSYELVAKIVERAKSRPSLGENAVDVIRRMRDGGWD